MKTISLKGYDKAAKWTTPDQATLLWMPLLSDKNYTFTLPKTVGNGSYKLIIEGENSESEVFHFEQLLK